MSLFEKRASLDHPMPEAVSEPLSALKNVRPIPNSFFSPRLTRPYDWEIDNSGLQDEIQSETPTNIGGTALTAYEIYTEKINAGKTAVNDLQHLE